MEKKKYIIILLIIFLVIILTICILLISILKKENSNEDNLQIEEELAEEVTLASIEPEQNKYIYITSNEIINKLFEYISEKEENVDNAEAILSVLDKDFIIKNNLSKENVIKSLANYKDINSYFSREIYRQEINYRQNVNGEYIYIKGIARKEGKEEDIYFLLKRDLVNSTYSITLIEKNAFEKIKTDKNLNNELEVNIEKNDYNEIYSKMVNDYEICLTYFNDYINTIKNNVSEGYKLLDEEYKNKRFGTINNYINYINSIKNRVQKIILKGYNITSKDEYNQYVCIDQYGNYYIFKNTDLMNYTLMLDTYTLDLPEFIEKYDGGTDEEKIKLNINKIIEAVNNQDYKYVYNKLNVSFKNNNFNNEATFENYIKNNFYEINEITNFNYRQEGNVFICTIGLGNKEKETEGAKSVTILVRLLENRDFEISFSQQ